MKKFLMTTIAACGIVSPGFSETTAWWRFDGTAGASATSVAPFVGTKSLAVNRVNGSAATQPTFDDASAGVFLITNRASFAALESPTTGSLRMPANSAATSPLYNSLLRCDNADGTVIGLDAEHDNDAQSFTVEIVFKMNSWNSTWPVLANFTGSGVAPFYLQPADPVAKTWQLRCDRLAGNESQMPFSFDSMDGNWHHLAATYDAATTNVVVYVDYVRKTSRKLKYPMAKTSTLDFGGQKFDGWIDEVRISRGVIDPAEFITLATDRQVNFFYPMNEGGNGSAVTPTSVRTAQSIILLPTSLKGATSGVYGYLYENGLPYAAAYATSFASGGAFASDPISACLFERDSFTLEAFVSPTNDAATCGIFTRDGVWELGLTDGELRWTRGENTTTFTGAALAKAEWHHVALSFATNATGAEVKAYLDGALVGTVAEGPFAAAPGAFAVAKDFGGRVYGLRGTQRVLEPSEFLQAPAEKAENEALVFWPLDAATKVGETVSSAYGGTFSAMDGYPCWGLRGGRFNGAYFYSAADTSAAEKWMLPIVTNETPNRVTWDAETGAIVNPENVTSVHFLNGLPNAVNSTAGGVLQANPSANVMPAEYTVEFFTKLERRIEYASIANMGASGNVQWMIDTNGGNGSPRVRLDLDGKSNWNAAWGGTLTNGWHHLAIQVLTNATGNALAKCYYDYVLKGTWDFPGNAWTRSSSYGLNFGAVCGRAWEGFIDEIRVTPGALDPSHFMRAYEPRTDLTGVWLTKGLDGREYYLPETNHLAGAFSGGVAESAELPYSGTSYFTSKGRSVKCAKSLAFDGTGAFTVPCVATVGTSNFTVEATLRGTGGIFAKKRFMGESWSVSADGDGVPSIATDNFVPGAKRNFTRGTERTAAASALLGDGAWHHVALTVDRTAAEPVAALYVDGVAAAEHSLAHMTLDAGDLVVGEGFSGEMLGFRFSPGVLAPSAFMPAHPPYGTLLLIK